jgi:RNA polymerase sigma-70 factor (ECF subfamily)
VVPAPDRAAEVVGRLYERHHRDVYRYLLGLTRSHQDAEDASEEAFVRAFRAILGGGGPGEPPLPWLLLTARRIALDRWRRLRRLAGLRGQHIPTIDADGGRERTEFWLWFDALAAVLSDRQREVLLLRYQRDLTDEQIGSVMGLTGSGVRSLVARALSALRAHPELLR